MQWRSRHVESLAKIGLDELLARLQIAADEQPSQAARGFLVKSERTSRSRALQRRHRGCSTSLVLTASRQRPLSVQIIDDESVGVIRALCLRKVRMVGGEVRMRVRDSLRIVRRPKHGR